MKKIPKILIGAGGHGMNTGDVTITGMRIFIRSNKLVNSKVLKND